MLQNTSMSKTGIELVGTGPRTWQVERYGKRIAGPYYGEYGEVVGFYAEQVRIEAQRQRELAPAEPDDDVWAIAHGVDELTFVGGIEWDDVDDYGLQVPF